MCSKHERGEMVRSRMELRSGVVRGMLGTQGRGRIQGMDGTLKTQREGHHWGSAVETWG